MCTYIHVPTNSFRQIRERHEGEEWEKERKWEQEQEWRKQMNWFSSQETCNSQISANICSICLTRRIPCDRELLTTKSKHVNQLRCTHTCVQHSCPSEWSLMFTCKSLSFSFFNQLNIDIFWWIVRFLIELSEYNEYLMLKRQSEPH